tara:strand:- start:59 stop:199 length:141 start_codon:yes stop_codon:yes gene_type:complete
MEDEFCFMNFILLKIIKELLSPKSDEQIQNRELNAETINRLRRNAV